jgi:hypothetical protein
MGEVTMKIYHVALGYSKFGTAICYFGGLAKCKTVINYKKACDIADDYRSTYHESYAVFQGNNQVYPPIGDLLPCPSSEQYIHTLDTYYYVDALVNGLRLLEDFGYSHVFLIGYPENMVFSQNMHALLCIQHLFFDKGKVVISGNDINCINLHYRWYPIAYWDKEGISEWCMTSFNTRFLSIVLASYIGEHIKEFIVYDPGGSTAYGTVYGLCTEGMAGKLSAHNSYFCRITIKSNYDHLDNRDLLNVLLKQCTKALKAASER